MADKEFITKNHKETEKFGSRLAKEVIGQPAGKISKTIGLEGELGAGKTTFVKGFAKAFGIKEKISSPTFVLMKYYELPTADYKLLYHIDTYRLKDHHDLISLGIKEILTDPKNIVLIEWSDRVEKILPKKYTKIHFDHVDSHSRKITIRR